VWTIAPSTVGPSANGGEALGRLRTLPVDHLVQPPGIPERGAIRLVF
jgi:hypothetical protein